MRSYKKIVFLGGPLLLGLLFLIFLTLLNGARLSIKEFGFKFLSSKTWDPVFGNFGALPFLIGTILTSIIALIISIPFSIALALFIGEYFRGSILSTVVESMVDLIAGIPSIIYGLWGFFFLTPVVRQIQMKLSIPPTGVSIFTASLLLAIMIVPFAASIGKEVIKMVPRDLKEVGYSFGATRYEVIKRIVLPYAKSGILAGVLLSLGRALGETMAVTMVIGNSNFIPRTIFHPGNTMASLIANEFLEAADNLHISALIHIALLLFLVTLIFNFLGNFLIKRSEIRL